MIVVNDQISASEVLVEEGFDLVALFAGRVVHGDPQQGARIIVHVCGNASRILERLRQVDANAFAFDSEVDVKTASAILEKPVVGCVKPSLINHFPPEMVLEETLISIQKGARPHLPALRARPGRALTEPEDHLRSGPPLLTPWLVIASEAKQSSSRTRPRAMLKYE